MKPGDEDARPLLLFTMVLALAAAFVWLSSASLPAMVASHFDASGRANGFMPREVYRWFMVAMVVLVPSLLATIPRQLFNKPDARINIPHLHYWLAPERRATTIAYLSGRSLRFAAMLAGFLCYGHWLVVLGNREVPPQLSSVGLLCGLAVFLFATFYWTFSLLRHFRKVPH